jgi:choice-of-anchor B domain-containing protein
VSGYRNFAYKVSQENSDGLQIIDLSPLNSGGKAILRSSSTLLFKVAHTVYVDSTTTPARLFVTYGQAAGIMIFTLADPSTPVKVAQIVGETHDMFARGDRMYASNQYKSAVTIWSLANLTAPVKLSTIDFNAFNPGINEPKASISHNAWPSEDNKTLYTTEETIGCSLKSWDISNATQSKPPVFLGKFMGVPGIIHHNVYVKGNLLFDAQYRAGLRVLDITDPKNMTEIAYSRHSTSTDMFSGSWGVYPWFKSGMIVHGDFEVGIRIERLDVSVSAKYPDPQDARFSIVARNDNVLNLRLSKTGPYELSIYSAAGKEIMNIPGRAESQLQTINLGNKQLMAGKYMARLRQDSRILTAPITMGN